MPGPQDLTLYRYDRGNHTTITLVGEIDLLTAPLMLVMIGECLREGIRTIDIDLTVLTFCDVSGINAFLAATKRVTAAGGSLRLLNPRPMLTRMLNVTGTGFLLQDRLPARGLPDTGNGPTCFGLLAS